MRKPAFDIGENKEADQHHANRKADHVIVFCTWDSTFPLLPKFKQFQASRLLLCLCRTW